MVGSVFFFLSLHRQPRTLQEDDTSKPGLHVAPGEAQSGGGWPDDSLMFPLWMQLLAALRMEFQSNAGDSNQWPLVYPCTTGSSSLPNNRPSSAGSGCSVARTGSGIRQVMSGLGQQDATGSRGS